MLLVAACGHAAPTEAVIAPADFTGNWSGAISRAPADTQAVFLTLTQQPLFLLPPGKGAQEQLTGTWSIRLSESSTVSDSGTVTGTGWSRSSGVALILQDAQGCMYDLSGTRTGAWAMSGTVAASGCSDLNSGTFAMTKLQTTAP